MRTIQLTPPAVEPLTLAEAKAHIHVDHGADDAAIDSLIVAARASVETDIRRVLIAQNWRLIIDSWPAHGRLMLPVVPLLAVVEVRAVDSTGAATTVPSSDYDVETENAVLAARSGASVLGSGAGAGGYEIDYTAGYGATGTDVPAAFRQAVAMLVAHWYENRGATGFGDTVRPTPESYRHLIAPYRRLVLC